jgi:predicted Zn-dependent protease
MQNLRRVSSLAVAVLLLAGFGLAQAGKKAAAPAGSSLAQGMALAQTGRCREALPLLKKGVMRLADRQLKYHAEMALARCAMSVNDDATAVETLLSLKREFPHDPEVLFIMTHYYGELANRAAQELAAAAPDSYQAQELEAEALESHGKWDDAAALYRKILQAHANVPGVHYHLGQMLLNNPSAASNTQEARQEFEKELRIDPSNASAEFILGELARPRRPVG